MQLQEKAKARKQSGTFLVEGKREIELALKGGYELNTLLFLHELFSEEDSRYTTALALYSGKQPSWIGQTLSGQGNVD